MSTYLPLTLIFHFKDPAYPGFGSIDKIDERLDPSDADFVDVIHTCAGKLGHKKNLGHVDFYPNGGKSTQPGCDFTSDFFGGCSHRRSFRYFAESVLMKNGFMAVKCNNWKDYRSKKCNGDPIPMGDPTPNTASGTYYLETMNGPNFAREIKKNIDPTKDFFE